MVALFQPSTGPRMVAYTRAARATLKVASPAQSVGWALGLRDSRTRRAPMTRAITPTGTLM